MSTAIRETPILFDCHGEQLLGIVAAAEASEACGVLVLVGGPQYRVGSHRQFVLLSRRLAAAGFPVMRFDFRGMGDSSGAGRDFEAVGDDIEAALAAFKSTCPGLERVVLWGLCDAASAALLYCQEHRDPMLAGLCLLNPWVRSVETLARTQVKHYYGRRLLDASFWLKLLQGRLNVLTALKELLDKLRLARRLTPAAPGLSFQARMAWGLRNVAGPVLLLLSGDDYTAKEFLERVAADPDWQGLLERPGLVRQDFPGADHTFSSAADRTRVEDAVIAWLESFRQAGANEAMG
jgi:exosortase A-associated hydrolase 1